MDPKIIIGGVVVIVIIIAAVMMMGGGGPATQPTTPERPPGGTLPVPQPGTPTTDVSAAIEDCLVSEGEYAESCVYAQGIKLMNPEICEVIPRDDMFFGQCIIGIVKLNGDVSLCERIPKDMNIGPKNSYEDCINAATG